MTKLVALGQIEDPKIEETSNKTRAKVIVYTKTGEVYKGFFVSQNKDFLEIETENNGTIKIPTQRIKNIESVDENSQANYDEKERLEQVNPVRYMLGTSAFNYEKGGNYIRNNPMTYHRGITDNFSIGVGTSPWALVFGIPILYLNPHFTKQLRENVHFKIGLDAFAGTSILEGEGAAAAILNTGITIGEPDLNLTGTIYYGAISGLQKINPFYSLAGMARVSKNLMVVSEGLYIPSEFNDDLSFVFYGGRYITDLASYDFGFFFNQAISEFIPFGVPFVAVTVKLY
ncbi:hypothetical protein QYS49_15795 [Marivirga salinae]|uniref:Uncharacterized protein n=1 Tax=Marivirga salinarum TaxID=3059078 RepID=A0AA49JC93_9BACT|nr:hypothetical protein [Marivirga sp. BDSF4-3]WKK78356.2 hypothetical protein QYS49_15795 [Marivirga sp. BDSF4-3]